MQKNKKIIILLGIFLLTVFVNLIGLCQQVNSQVGNKRRDLFKPLVKQEPSTPIVTIHLNPLKILVDGQLLEQGNVNGPVTFLRQTGGEILLRISGVLCKIILDGNNDNSSKVSYKTKDKDGK